MVTDVGDGHSGDVFHCRPARVVCRVVVVFAVRLARLEVLDRPVGAGIVCRGAVGDLVTDHV